MPGCLKAEFTNNGAISCIEWHFTVKHLIKHSQIVLKINKWWAYIIFISKQLMKLAKLNLHHKHEMVKGQINTIPYC